MIGASCIKPPCNFLGRKVQGFFGGKGGVPGRQLCTGTVRKRKASIGTYRLWDVVRRLLLQVFSASQQAPSTHIGGFHRREMAAASFPPPLVPILLTLRTHVVLVLLLPIPPQSSYGKEMSARRKGDYGFWEGGSSSLPPHWLAGACVDEGITHTRRVTVARRRGGGGKSQPQPPSSSVSLHFQRRKRCKKSVRPSSSSSPALLRTFLSASSAVPLPSSHSQSSPASLPSFPLASHSSVARGRGRRGRKQKEEEEGREETSWEERDRKWERQRGSAQRVDRIREGPRM